MVQLRFGSLFAGIGGFDLGFERAGMTCEWQVEIDSHCNFVLEKQWLEVKRIDDIKKSGKRNLAAVDLISGGFPCQDVSIAGKRQGLAGKRSGLWFEFHRILEELRPEWVVVENVTGLLSSNEGRDLAAILRGLEELGYMGAYRVLDAQYFGVAQRRRRLFIIGHLGDGRAAEVLFERESCEGDPAEGREEGQSIARPIVAGSSTDHFDESQQTYIVNALTSNPANRLSAEDNYVVFSAKDDGRDAGKLCPTLRSMNYNESHLNGGGQIAIAFAERTRKDGRNLETQDELAYALTNPGSGGRTHCRHIAGSFGVRRLMPVECERLQGFPDGWTDGQSDSQRYRQLGNAVCVPVSEWIGRRIMECES